MTLFRTNKKIRYAIEECVYQISGLYLFSFGQGVRHRQTDRQRPDILANIGIPYRLPALRGFGNVNRIIKRYVW